MTRRLSARRIRELDPRLAWLLMMLYPRAWRDRYGAEVLRLTRELIAAGETTPARAAVNLACAAFVERCRMLGDSWRPAMATAAMALVAVAGGLYLAGQASPVRTAARARPVSAAPAPVKLTRLLCVFARPAVESLTPGRHTASGVVVVGPVVRLMLQPTAKIASGHPVAVWVTATRPGPDAIRRCLVEAYDKNAAAGP